MFNYIREWILPSPKRYPYHRESYLMTVLFRRRKSLIIQGNVEEGRCYEMKKRRKGSGYIQQCNNRIIATTSLVKKLYSSCRDFIPRIVNKDKMKDLTDFRPYELYRKVKNFTIYDFIPKTVDLDGLKDLVDWRRRGAFDKMKITNKEESQSLSWCIEIPKKFAFKQSVDENIASSSKSTIFWVNNLEKLEENDDSEMKKMVSFLKNEKEKREEEKIKFSSSEVSNEQKSAVVSHKVNRQDVSINRLDNFSNTRVIATKSAEKSQIKDSRNGLIDINDVVEMEEKVRYSRLPMKVTTPKIAVKKSDNTIKEYQNEMPVEKRVYFLKNEIELREKANLNSYDKIKQLPQKYCLGQNEVNPKYSKGFDQSKVQGSKEGLINIDQILEYEGKNRYGFELNKNRKIVEKVTKNENQNYEKDMGKFFSFFKNEKELREKEKLITSPNEMSNYKLQTGVNTLNNLLKSRMIPTTESEKSQVQDRKKGLVNIDDVLVLEEKDKYRTLLNTDITKALVLKTNKTQVHDGDMQNIFSLLRKERELIGGGNLTSSPKDIPNQKPLQPVNQNKNSDFYKNRLEDLLKPRDMAVSESEKSQVQESKKGLIDINDVIKYEEKNRHVLRTSNDSATAPAIKTNLSEKIVNKSRAYSSDMKAMVSFLKNGKELRKKDVLLRNNNEVTALKTNQSEKIENKSRGYGRDMKTMVNFLKNDKELRKNDVLLANNNEEVTLKTNESGKIDNKSQSHDRDMKTMVSFLKNAEDLRKKENLKSLPSDTSKQQLQQSATSSEQDIRKFFYKNRRDSLLKFREMAEIELENSEVQESKTELIDMNDVIHYEEKIKNGVVPNDDKITAFEVMTTKFKKPEIDGCDQNYLQKFFELNRIMDRKVMKAGEDTAKNVEY